jgi:molybdate transport system substrate-binding protein
LADHCVWAGASKPFSRWIEPRYSIAMARSQNEKPFSAGSGRLREPGLRWKRLEMEDIVRLLSTLALKGAVRELAGRYQAERGVRIDADFAPTLALLDRLRGGEAADVVVLTREGLDDLAAEGTVVADSRVDLARSHVGIAVRAGTRHPDIATEAALRTALLGAQSVAYSRIGASGILFARLIEQMGIASEINARARITPSGFTAERLVSGEADLAVQQISELKQVAGVEIVGPIPLHLQIPAVFSAGRLAASTRVGPADRLLHYLASPEVAPVLRESGLEPWIRPL